MFDKPTVYKCLKLKKLLKIYEIPFIIILKMELRGFYTFYERSFKKKK